MLVWQAFESVTPACVLLLVLLFRGGPGASTHVEILGNEPMLQDLLNIVAGKGEGMEEQYFSDIRNIASKIPWDKL